MTGDGTCEAERVMLLLEVRMAIGTNETSESRWERWVRRVGAREAGEVDEYVKTSSLSPAHLHYHPPLDKMKPRS
ncbi:hypothetical protein Pcinc_018431 [Petrolisthes cinctipes]|uniref:Uncharacterized protein n=1 Tax=Petrolisthes cinctipes TaxID=88211 RepID=A0AAE1FS40_PETCI|nr:hypothetical protein Pcinc_018431 [Petrolisthes cinctipes]